MTSRADLLTRVELWARDLLEADPYPAHGWSHVERVRRMATYIARAEGLDPWLAALAALIHDVGRTVPGPASEHGKRSADMAAPLLAQLPMADSERLDVLHAVHWHSSLRSDTPLLCVLRDADMLDGLGAIGVMRACTSNAVLPLYRGETWSGEGFHRPPQDIIDQVRFQMYWIDNFNTETARRIARTRLAWMETFVEQLQREALALDSE